MNSLVLAARLHSLEGAREDIAKAIESWHLSKQTNTNYPPGYGVSVEEQRRNKAERGNPLMGPTDDSGNVMNAKQIAVANRKERDQRRNEAKQNQTPATGGRITDADRAKVDQILGQNNAQSNVDGSSKGVDNPAQSIKDRFDRRQAGNPSMGDKMRQQFGKVRQQVGDFRQRMGAKASEGLSEAGQMIGDAATAAKEKMGELGQRTDDAMMGAARSLGRGVGTARAKGSEMMDSAKEKAGQMGAKASELGGGMLDAAKRMGEGAMGKFSNVAGRVPGMMQAARRKAGEIGAGVMGAAGQVGRKAMSMASQLPGQISGAVQGAMYGSQGGANRGGAYLPGIGGRVGNFAHGLKQGGLSGLMEQGVVGTTRAGQQDRYNIGRQESKDMRRLYDQNQTLGRRDSAMQGLSPEQQAAYSYDPSSQPAPQGGQDMDGDGQPDVKQTVEVNGQTGEQKQTTTITPQPMTPAGTSTGGGGGGGQGGSLFDLAPEQYRNTGGGGGGQGGQGGQVAGNLGGGNIAQASSNSSGNTVNVYGGGGQGGGQAPAQPQQNMALDALTADAAQRASKTGGLATNVGLGLLTGGLSNIGGALYNRGVRRQGRRDLQDLASQYRKSDEMASTLRIRQDIEKGRLGDFINSIRSGGMRLKDEGMEKDRYNKRKEAIERIERGRNFNPKTRGRLTNEQYERAADVVQRLYEKGGPNISAFSSPPPAPAPAPAPIPAVVPEAQPIERDDILNSEPWTVVENPFANPFYSQNAFDLRKEPAPEAEIEKSVIEDFVTEEAPIEQEVNLEGFDTVDGDDLSLLPASVFAKSNPVGDNMSLLPSGWGQDAE